MCRLRFPLCLGSFKLFQQTFFVITKFCSFLKILAFHYAVFLNLYLFNTSLQVHNF